MNDEELAKGLGLYSDPRWPQAIAKLTPKKRVHYERMLNVTTELQVWEAGAGPLPAGILIDTDRSTRRRKGWR
jgi:hypothetical protein